VRRQPRHRRVISDTTEEDIEDMNKDMDDGQLGLVLVGGSSDMDMADANGSVAPSGGRGRDPPSIFSVDDETRAALILINEDDIPASATLVILVQVLHLLVLRFAWPFLVMRSD
jgi:hypothetical protein